MLQTSLRRAAVLTLAGAFAYLLTCPARLLGAEPANLDKAHLITYLRYAEGWTDSVEAVADDPKPSPIPGFSEVDVHLKFPNGKLDRVYYLSSDGKSLVGGNLYDLADSPFKPALSKLKPNVGPSRGPEDAPVTIVVFGDFECPFCKEASKVLTEDVPRKYPKEVRVVFKDFPLEPMHPWARKAALAGHCVIEQNPAAYWPYHETMYAHQAEINAGNLDAKLQEFAAKEKLDALRLSTCVQTKATAAMVEAGEAEGHALGVSQTPTMFINGRMVAGALPLEKLDMVIQWELKQSASGAKTASEKCCEVTPPTLAK